MAVSRAEKQTERDRHFFPGGKVTIHVVREGTCSKGDCDYREHVRSSRKVDPGTGDEYEPHEAHHVICVSTMVGYLEKSLGYSDKVKDKIRRVCKPCEWCINQEPNMLWMPLKSTYRDTSAGDSEHAVWDLDLPCHNWDHNCKKGYTDEVLDEMKKRIWDRIRDSPGPDRKCFKKQDVELAIEALERDLKDWVKARGRRDIPRSGSGTKAARKVLDDATLRSARQVPMWWLPFSMAKLAVAATRPVPRFGDRPRTRRR